MIPYMDKKILVMVILAIVAAAAFARGVDEPGSGDPVEVRLIVPNGATLATVALLEDDIAPGYEVNLEVIMAPDLLAAKIISGEADLAVIPSNLAAVLANKETGLRMAGPAIWGLLYVVSSEDLQGWEDLRGRTVNMIGRGLTPDITFRHLLRENGLEPDVDVELTYASGAAELAPAFLTGRSTVSMMPEPMITTVLSRKPDTRILVDVQEEWAARYGSSYPQASLVVAGDFAEAHPAYLDKFVDAFSWAIEQAKTYPDSAGEAVAALSPGLNAEVFAAAIPRMNLDFVPASRSREAFESYFSVLESFNPATIGGKIPSDEFYLP